MERFEARVAVIIVGCGAIRAWRRDYILVGRSEARVAVILDVPIRSEC